MVREFEEERTRRLAIVVDTERDAGETWTPLDRCCSVAASVLEAASAHGTGARLIAGLPGGEVDVLLRADTREALRWLARLERGGPSLGAVLDGLRHDEMRGVESILIATPVWKGSRSEELVANLTRLGQVVTRLVVVPVGVSRADRELDAFVDALEEAGVDARPWQVDGDLAVSIGGGGAVLERIGRSVRFALRRPPTAPPEDSVAIRVVVALAVEAGILAVVLQAAVDPLSAVAALVLAPLGYLFSYRHRATSNLAVKVVLSVALLASARPVPLGRALGQQR